MDEVGVERGLRSTGDVGRHVGVGFDVVDLADDLVHSCLEFLPVSAAGILLDDQQGHLRVLASSTEEMRVLELLELQHSEGPCYEAFVTGEPVDGHAPAGPRRVLADLRAGRHRARRGRRLRPAAEAAGPHDRRAQPLLRRDDRDDAHAAPGGSRDGQHGDPGHPQPLVGAPPGAARRAAADRAQQPGRHRAGQGRHRRAVQRRHGHGLRAAAHCGARAAPPAVRAGRRGGPGRGSPPALALPVDRKERDRVRRRSGRGRTSRAGAGPS